MNLGTNAAHAIGERSGLVELRLEALELDAGAAQSLHDLRAGEYVRISVVDNGCGIDDDTLERIFDPFFTTKPTGQGTGLGLAIVHGIVKSHEGAVRVSSHLGIGTRFEIYLPATGRPIVDAPKTLAPQSAGAAGAQQHVLYLDDEEPLVALMTRMLERLNYRVTGFVNPAEALQVFRQRPESFHLFITDLAMPGLSGFDVVREALSVRSDIPIIMTSGYLRPHDVERAQLLGIRALLLKPDSASDLAKAVHDVFATPVEK
jgi:CheY-like chemotaxis protein